MPHPNPFLRTCALAALLALAGAADSGARSEPEEEEQKPVVLTTEAHDQQAGEKAAEQVANDLGIVEEPAIQQLVEGIGQRLVRHAPRTGFTYRFRVVDQNAPNAMALPGGYIYVSRGLLLLSNSEDELAGVIGHEIAHAARRHAAARQSMLRQIPIILSITALGRIAAYGRDQERDADTLGQQLAALAGYDPAGIAAFLTALDNSERLQLGFSRGTGYFDTHPATRERVAAAGDRGRTLRWQPQPGVAGTRKDYLRLLEGLVVGMAASEGVIDGDRFLHPDLGFSMRFPAGWQLVNTRQAVAATSPTRDGQIVLELHGEGSDPKAASEEWLAEAEQQGVQVERGQAVRIGTLDAYRIEGRARAGSVPLSVHVTWIAREGAIYRLRGLAVGTGGPPAFFHNVARSFRPISGRERRSVHETRLALATALPNEPLAELSRRTGNRWNIQETAVANGLFADERLQEGQLVKIARQRSYESPEED